MPKFSVALSRSQYLNVKIDAPTQEAASRKALENYLSGIYDNASWDTRSVGDEPLEIVNWVEPLPITKFSI